MRAGGIEAVVVGMGAHPWSAGVQEQGCAALVNLAVDDENETAIMRAGFIEAVVVGMGAHRSIIKNAHPPRIAHKKRPPP